MRKLTLPIIILLTIICGLFIFYNFHYKKSNLTTKKILKTNIASVNTNNDMETTDQPNQLYEILGNSNKLSANQWQDMLKWRRNIVKFASDYPGQMFINGPTNKKKVALTFDDGPDGFITPQIIDILQQYQVKGSFFFVGNRLDRFSGVVKKAYANGNLVLSHTWSHPFLAQRNPGQIRNELVLTEDKIFQIIGRKPAIVRPPYGDVNAQVATAIGDNNTKIALWSIDSLDWSQREKDNIVNNIVNNVRPGDIILMHSNEDKIEDVKALPIIITELHKKGYEFVDLGEMLGINPYK